MKMKKHLLTLFGLLLGLVPLTASAWWNEAWTERRVVTLDTSPSGVEIAAPVAAPVLPLRLHSGNFDFLAAKPDGADLRLVAGDDKTPLKFHIERFDSANELAVVWVQVPQVLPKTSDQKVYVYFGNAAATAEGQPAAASYDAATVAVFQFAEDEATPRDATANANHAQMPVALEKAGILGASARLFGTPLVLPASPSLRLAANGGFSFSAWIKPDELAAPLTLYQQGALVLAIEGGKLNLRGAGAPLSGGSIVSQNWQHVAVSVGGGAAALFVNGVQVASGPASLPEVQAEVSLAQGLRGLIDEVQIASAARGADWVRLNASAQGAETKLIAVREDAAAEGGSHSYLGILIDSLTVDAWVVIIILAFMFAIALWVMADKGLMVSRVDKDNRGFLQRFRTASEDFLRLHQGAAHPHSSLFRLYQAGIREVEKRQEANGDLVLTGASIDAIKAAVDADMVRENHRLNARMVLLTIAISGGPFLGLLGTVVGVMITFAAIAAAGDVNVNAIAPGIAAALLATVAGLAVAIPALFGYNYLASRIKNISADMQIFVDEFITRLAEAYGR